MTEITKKGFQIIKMNTAQMLKIGGLCICDDCNNAMFSSTYIGALNSCYCDDCFKDFEERATYYPEDKGVETNNINRVTRKLEL
ncbi:hypothetical protein [Flavobacterium sp.]|uniref:hypothetical protein n=1 Tax=Flavobacterium sp. TaxID=239 RepID=UPI003D6AE8D7